MDNKEVKSVDEKPAETNAEETTKEQIILPDEEENGRETESVDENLTETDSQEVTDQQTVQPDGKE